jgi:hypothetical protein
MTGTEGESGFFKFTQFGLANGELCEAAIRADQQRGKYPDCGLAQISKSGEVDADFCREFPLVN